jgi:hypothetical protein
LGLERTQSLYIPSPVFVSVPQIFSNVNIVSLEIALRAANMENTNQISPLDEKSTAAHEPVTEHVANLNAELSRTGSHLDNEHINLSWRSWMVVFVTCFA